ncbi:homoisocitrate dehydrogenase [Blastocladiella emersonii ATCC 22665]|nr:homoisocitrate dehydrogenase [Blastocladiella emersonii ATCC 22665]
MPRRLTTQSSVPCDILIVRDYTESLYIKQERLETDPEMGLFVAYATRRISERTTQRVARVAFIMARARAAARPEGRSWSPLYS